MRQQLSRRDFLRKVRELFNIALIYYPGYGEDNFLEEVFKAEEIVYLDNESGGPISYKANRNYVKGDFGKPPFKDGTFDAIFYQENHADLEETIKMLRTLRRGGIVIHSDDECILQCLDEEDFMRMPGLSKIDLPFSNPRYNIFQKNYPHTTQIFYEFLSRCIIPSNLGYL
ncbi:hypothetical protein HYT53_00925 [Candidatus Woesearchaeota archaeon]|nr:hypothetical protein [Candidatus Woesearchaeota archaeon]